MYKFTTKRTIVIGGFAKILVLVGDSGNNLYKYHHYAFVSLHYSKHFACVFHTGKDISWLHKKVFFFLLLKLRKCKWKIENFKNKRKLWGTWKQFISSFCRKSDNACSSQLQCNTMFALSHCLTELSYSLMKRLLKPVKTLMCDFKWNVLLKAKSFIASDIFDEPALGRW